MYFMLIRLNAACRFYGDQLRDCPLTSKFRSKSVVEIKIVSRGKANEKLRTPHVHFSCT